MNAYILTSCSFAWVLALLAMPLAFWPRRNRPLPVLLVPFAAAWHRTSVSPRRWFPLMAALAAGLAKR